MNANDELKQYTCSDNYFRYLFNMLFTDGIKALCERYDCYWLLDMICSYQPELTNEEFQVWTLMVNKDSSAVVSATDGNERVLTIQTILYTDFRANSVEVWVSGNIVYLPSEH